MRLVLHVLACGVPLVFRWQHPLVQRHLRAKHIALLQGLFDRVENRSNFPCTVDPSVWVLVVGEVEKFGDLFEPVALHELTKRPGRKRARRVRLPVVWNVLQRGQHSRSHELNHGQEFVGLDLLKPTHPSMDSES